ncbi:hypothetical protein RUMOBE_03222, partial [Blautia obeum ATCC 29174]
MSTQTTETKNNLTLADPACHEPGINRGDKFHAICLAKSTKDFLLPIS